ncbi:hypothetical protein [Nocardia testacea]|uniref:hypothetical protein n=1 Tax=Nocardia testacea TaxID=248551 RepID=UPI000685FA4E|nr:hypothetical protein [Nocardia testacea]
MTSRLEQTTTPQSPPDEVVQRPRPDVVGHRPRQREADMPSRPDDAAACEAGGDDAAVQERRNNGAGRDGLANGAGREALDHGAAQKTPGDDAGQKRSDDGAAQQGPGGTRYSQRKWQRTAVATLLAVLITPVAVGIAANGAVTAGRWWDTTDRWLSPAQSLLGAAVLASVAVLAAYEPAAAMIAGLVWGVVPAAVQMAAPGQTYRLISSLPVLPSDLARALHTWWSSGVVLLVGVLMVGIGIAAALRRRGLPG